MPILFVDMKEDPTEPTPCSRTREQIGYEPMPHARFWALRRQPAGQMGHFMVFRLNGREWPIDASLPTHLDRIPRDATLISGELAEKISHCRCGSHTFGCCYIREVDALLPANPRAGRLPQHRRF